MLVWLSEQGMKTRKGQGKGYQKQFRPKIYATSTYRCLNSYYELFLSHNPAEMNELEAPFFLTVNNKRQTENPFWYMKAPLGKNQIRKFIANAAKNAGIQLPGR